MNSQRGFSLVEVAIVLAIVGLVIAGVWAAASSVAQNRRLIQANEQVLQIIQNVRKLYASQMTMPSVELTADLETAGVFPSEMRTGTAGVIRHPWGGTVAITGSGTSFTVQFDDIPAKACMTFGMQAVANFNAMGLIEFQYNGNGVDLNNTTMDPSECYDTGNTAYWVVELNK